MTQESDIHRASCSVERCRFDDPYCPVANADTKSMQSLEDQRDELLAALKRLLIPIVTVEQGIERRKAMQAAEELVASVEGGK